MEEGDLTVDRIVEGNRNLALQSGGGGGLLIHWLSFPHQTHGMAML